MIKRTGTRKKTFETLNSVYFQTHQETKLNCWIILPLQSLGL